MLERKMMKITFTSVFAIWQIHVAYKTQSWKNKYPIENKHTAQSLPKFHYKRISVCITNLFGVLFLLFLCQLQHYTYFTMLLQVAP